MLKNNLFFPKNCGKQIITVCVEIDLHWVRALTVPMHLGLTDGPFVPHNLLSAQESPVPLTKFQMAPRLKILMSTGSKKGNQTYYSFLSKKSRQANSLHVPQRGPHSEKDPLTGHFYISLTYLSWSPVREPSLQVSLMGSPQRDAPFLEPSFIHHSKSQVYEPPPDSRFPSDIKGPL